MTHVELRAIWKALSNRAKSDETECVTPAEHPAVRGDHTIRSLLALLRPHRRRISAATLAFVVKDSPFWVMPIITANIIDAVVAGNTIRPVLVNGGVGAVVVLLNLPSNAVFVRNLSATVRDVGVNLRNALTHHLQERQHRTPQPTRRLGHPEQSRA